MSDEAQPLYSDDGQHVGWTVEAEDGAIIALDLDATGIVGAMDPGTGELLDHSAYEMPQADYEDYEDPRLAELYEAQAQLEQRLSQPQEVIHRHEVAALSEDDIHARWGLEKEILEGPGGFGRPLTQRELVELGQESAESGDYSLIAAAERRADRGQPLRDVDVAHPGRAHAERVELAAELLEERSDSPPDPFTGMRERQQETYDRSTSAGRQAMIEDAINGHDVRGRDTDVADTTYPATEESWYDDGDLD